MKLLLLGINHETAPLAVREQVTFSAGAIAPALQQMCHEIGLREALILSTCNRTELVAVGHSQDLSRLGDWLAHYHNLEPTLLQDSLYSHLEEDAAKHLMRVTSGLDSMVLGEPQITGQVKAAFAEATAAGTVGATLHRLFQQIFQVAKQVRTDTAIGQHLISTPAAAIKLAKNLFTNLSDCRCLLVGVGDMIELAAKQLIDAGVTQITIANRTKANASSLAERCGGDVLGLEQLPEYLERFDLILSATGANLPIIGKGMVEQALRRRKHAPMFLVDLAVPRDIEPEITTLRDVYLYSLDDLQNIVSENMDLRRSAAGDAEAIVQDAAITYKQGEKTRAGQDLVVRYRKQLEGFKDAELAKAMARVKQGDDIDLVLKTLATQLTQKLAHTPSVGLKSLIIDGDAAAIEQAKILLGLNQDDTP